MYKDDPSFLTFLGVYIIGQEAYLVFENFDFTLENALIMGIFKEQKDKIGIIAQISKILEKLQTQKKMHLDFRPGIFGLKSNFQVKLLDFGKY